MSKQIEKCLPPSWWQFPKSVWLELNHFFRSLYINEDKESARFLLDTLLIETYWRSVDLGESHHNYQVSIKTNDYFVQINRSKSISKTPSGKFFPVYSKLEKHNNLSRWLANCLYESPTLKVFEWHQGVHLEINKMLNLNIQSQMIDFLTILHHSKIDLPELNIANYLEKYCEGANPSSREYQLLQFELNELKQERADFFLSQAPCHHDLSPSNLLLTDRLYVLDWEYSAISDPLMDLASLSINFELPDTAEKEFLNRYQASTRRPINIGNYFRIKELCKAINYLWKN